MIIAEKIGKGSAIQISKNLLITLHKNENEVDEIKAFVNTPYMVA